MVENITRKETLDGVGANDQGTGIYWFVDPSGEYEQIFVPQITRERSDELAKDFDSPGKQKLDAYRWVPEKLGNAGVLIMQSCSGSCQKNVDCIDSACKCIRGQCSRKGK